MEMQTETKLKPAKIFSVCDTPWNLNEALLPIIFIHGMGATNRTWNIVKFKISENTKRKVFVIDLRNHGKSEWCEGISLNHHVTDLEHFMEKEGIAKAVLVGHSLGGRVALAMTLKKPEMVEKLVVMDTALKDAEDVREVYKRDLKFSKTMSEIVQGLPATMSEMEAQKKLIGLLAKFWPQLCGNTSAANITVTLPIYKDNTRKFMWEINIEALSKMAIDPDKREIDLSGNPIYDGDLLLMGGDKSIFLKPSDVELYLKHFPKCQHYVFPNGLHSFHLEFPVKFIEMVSNFIGV